MRKQTYAELIAAERLKKETSEAERAADDSFGLKITGVLWFAVLMICGISIFVIFGGCLSGGWPWVALLWPIGIASGSTLLAFFFASIFGLSNGLRDRRKDRNGWVN